MEPCVENVSNSTQIDRSIHQENMQQKLEYKAIENIQQDMNIGKINFNSKNSRVVKSTTTSASGNRGPETKLRTVDWVCETFVTQKKPMNVPMNHSCQEIPFQNCLYSPKSNTATRIDNQQ